MARGNRQYDAECARLAVTADIENAICAAVRVELGLNERVY